MNILNPERKIKKIESPYEIWILDDFLLPEVPEKINAEWPSNDDPVWFRGIEQVDGKKNILEQGMLAISSYDKMPTHARELLQYFHTPEFTEKIAEITGKSGLLPDETVRWSGVRAMLPGGFQLIHSDARKNPISGMKKELTVLYYLNKDYNKERDAGCLEVWDDDMTHCVHEIEPLYNRLVIFLCSDTSFHGVPKVNKERHLLTFSIVKDEESTNRMKALFVARPTDSDEVRELGIKRSLVEDKKY